MSKNNSLYSYRALNSLSHVYRCVECGTYVSKQDFVCYRCNHEFTKNDCARMIEAYKKTKQVSWPDMLLFVVVFLLVLLVSV